MGRSRRWRRPSDGLVRGLVTIKANYTETGNFAVWACDDSRRSLDFNEIDKFNGESLLPDGTVVIALLVNFVARRVL